MSATKSVRLAIHSAADVVTARQQAREISEKLGCFGATQVMVAAVVSEVARKVAEHPLPGEMLLSITRGDHDLVVTMTVRIHYADRTTGLEIGFEPVLQGCEVAQKTDHTVVKLTRPVDSEPSKITPTS